MGERKRGINKGLGLLCPAVLGSPLGQLLCKQPAELSQAPLLNSTEPCTDRKAERQRSNKSQGGQWTQS